MYLISLMFYWFWILIESILINVRLSSRLQQMKSNCQNETCIIVICDWRPHLLCYYEKQCLHFSYSFHCFLCSNFYFNHLYSPQMVLLWCFSCSFISCASRCARVKNSYLEKASCPLLKPSAFERPMNERNFIKQNRKRGCLVLLEATGGFDEKRFAHPVLPLIAV